MSRIDAKWSLSGDCVEACTSPTVCPYYWGSAAPTDLHDGKDQCEGVFTFRIGKGHYERLDLSGIIAGYGFNTGIGGPGSKDPWKSILYIDARATETQFKRLEEIFRACWNLAGQVIKVKKIQMMFIKEQMGTNTTHGYKHEVRWGQILRGAYNTLHRSIADFLRPEILGDCSSSSLGAAKVASNV